MRNAIHIFQREYIERVRTKAFKILTVMAPLFFIAMFVGPAYFMARSSKTQKLAIVDLDGRLGSLVEQRLTEKKKKEEVDPAQEIQKAQKGGGRGGSNPYLEDQYQVELVKVAPGQEDATRAELSARVNRKDLDAYVWLNKDVVTTGAGDYCARNTADFGGSETVQRSVSSAVTQVRLTDRGVPSSQIDDILKHVDLRRVKVSEKGEKEDKGIAGFLLPFLFTMLLYMTLLMYGIMVMRSVLEEKTSRVFEVLLSSVKPIELMAGKILGVAAVALTQYAVWLLMFTVAGGAISGAAAAAQLGDLSVPTMTLVYFVIFFVLGYLMFSSMYAAVGAASNSDQDAQQLSMMILPFIVVPMLSLQMVLRSPSGTASVFMSLFPLFSPILMFVRITVEPPPTWQIALSISLLAATTFFMMWLCSRIYRVGILMYGKRPTLPEIMRWIRIA